LPERPAKEKKKRIASHPKISYHSPRQPALQSFNILTE